MNARTLCWICLRSFKRMSCASLAIGQWYACWSRGSPGRDSGECDGDCSRARTWEGTGKVDFQSFRTAWRSLMIRASNIAWQPHLHVNHSFSHMTACILTSTAWTRVKRLCLLALPSQDCPNGVVSAASLQLFKYANTSRNVWIHLTSNMNRDWYQ